MGVGRASVRSLGSPVVVCLRDCEVERLLQLSCNQYMTLQTSMIKNIPWSRQDSLTEWRLEG